MVPERGLDRTCPFSDNVWDSEKAAMVDAFKKPKMQHDLQRVDPKTIVAFQTKTLIL